MDVGSGNLLRVQVHGVAKVSSIQNIQQDAAQEHQHHQQQDQAHDAQANRRLQINKVNDRVSMTACKGHMGPLKGLG